MTAQLLEQSLNRTGDLLYRLAIAAAGDEAGAARLLRELAATMGRRLAGADGPATPPDEAELVAELIVAARRDEERAAAATRPARRTRRQGPPRVNLFHPFALHHLPLDQRMALALHLLAGYDGLRIARALGCGPTAARRTLIDAVRALGPAAGATLTDRFSGEQCDQVREVLADPAAGSRQSAAVRGHLAGCASCRAFDQAWGAILHPVEGALRDTLRERSLPAPLRAAMLAQAAPKRRGAASLRLTRLALAPLGVLALIVALALPGFLRRPVTVVERDAGPPVDAQALVQQALVRHSVPPEKSGVWHGRYETLWYFTDEVYAPLLAEVWLDPANPARHRLQLSHREGGAPYELQVGDGEERLSYALDGAYATSLYGPLPLAARLSQPILIDQQADAAAQERARDERLESGPWSLPPAYLRQAQAAEDLRLLGRQRDGGRTVQILSFSGVSPLGLPPDAPGATAERVTVLLALDSEDGLLRKATELSGPRGAAQTSRITWRLIDEQWLVGAQSLRDSFAMERAWTGIGDFAEARRATSADLALPLISARDVSDPAALLAKPGLPVWLPTHLPPGVERALLVWDGFEGQGFDPPQGLVYLGAGRRLVLAFNSSSNLAGEAAAIGPWRITLAPERGQRYRAVLARAEASPELRRLGLSDASANLMLDAVGFSREELEAIIGSMAPFDAIALAAQSEVFVAPAQGDPAARAALIEAALRDTQPSPEGAWHLTSRWYSRQAPGLQDPRSDPYHQPPYDGRPEVTAAQEWVTGAGDAVAIYVASSDPRAGGAVQEFYADSETLWSYLPGADALERWPSLYTPYSVRLPRLAGMAIDLLYQPGELTMESLPDGGRVVLHRQQAMTSARYSHSARNDAPAEPHLFDLQPITMTTELELDAEGAPRAARVYAESRGAGRTRTLVESYELVSRQAVPLSEAPAALREGARPAAAFVRESGWVQRQVGTPLRSAELGQLLGRSEGPVFVPDPAQAELLLAEEGSVVAPSADLDYGALAGDPLAEAVARRLAVRLAYRAPPGEYTTASRDIQLVQGPAGPFRAFLRMAHMVPWDWSEPVVLRVAGREVQGWYGGGPGRNYLMFELDEVLVIVDTRFATDEPGLLAILDGLRPAEQ